jgi:hypothetical protein
MDKVRRHHHHAEVAVEVHPKQETQMATAKVEMELRHQLLAQQ